MAFAPILGARRPLPRARSPHDRLLLLISMAGLFAGGSWSCGEPSTAPQIAQVVIAPQTATLSAGTSLQLTASALDSRGRPIANATFVWSSSDEEAVSVSSSGLAQGRKARSATVTVKASEVSASATITVVTGPPHSLAKISGDGQTGAAGEELGAAVTVRIADAFDNPVAGTAVGWTTGGDNGSISPDLVTTNEAGLASTRWTLGRTKGTHTLRAVAVALPGSAVAFLATATPNGRISGQVISAGVFGATAASRRASGARITTGAAMAGSPSVLPARSPASMPRTVAGLSSGRVPGSLIVRFRAQSLGLSSAAPITLRAPAVLRAVEGRMRSQLESAGRAMMFAVAGTSPMLLAARIRVDPSREEAVRAELVKNPAVVGVHPETFVYALELPKAPTAALLPSHVPNDPLYFPQAWHYAMIDLPEAWRVTTGSPSVLVAVVDDGIRFDHPAVAANLTKDGYDFVSVRSADVCGVARDNAGDGDGYDPDPTNPAAYDCDGSSGLSTIGGHGLHVAGTIGAVGDDAVGTAGASWSVKIRPVRVLGVAGFGTNYDVAQGILYAAGLPADNGAGATVQPPTGARIINLSLGGPSDTSVVRDAVRAATAAGALIVAAAGNAGTSAPHYPAAYPEVLSVSAVGPGLQLASYSSFGPGVDIAAPGGDFDVCGASCMVASTTWNFVTQQPSYAFYAGTSMAAPHVSGVAALVLAASPSLSPEQLRERLTSFAVDLGPAGRDDQYGAGVLNAMNSVTATLGPERARYAVLFDAQTGTRMRTTRVGDNGTFTFAGLDDGRYYVYAGEDEAGDGLVGAPGRRWAAYGAGASRPSEVVVAGAGNYPTSLVAGWPDEVEPNDDPGTGERLVAHGYVQGRIGSAADRDVFTIVVPAGRYLVAASPWDGACGFALDADTVLELLDVSGAPIASNDDIDSGSRNFCSQVTTTLASGTYHVRVTAPGKAQATAPGGRYRLALSPAP
jgi:subtilisin family serine protease